MYGHPTEYAGKDHAKLVYNDAAILLTMPTADDVLVGIKVYPGSGTHADRLKVSLGSRKWARCLTVGTCVETMRK